MLNKNNYFSYLEIENKLEAGFEFRISAKNYSHLPNAVTL